MEHTKTIVIKFFMTLAIVWFILGGMYNLDFGHVLTLSAILTGISYVIGDLYILPRFENWGATLADFFLAFVVIWLYVINVVEGNLPVLTAAAITALVLSLGEWFFHKYVDRHVLEKARHEKRRRNVELQTEFGEEINPPDEDESRKK